MDTCVITKLLSCAEQPAVHISIDTQSSCTCCDSKFGGSFYLPRGAKVPLGKSGEPMEFLAQVHFAQMPTLEGFPQEGLLQFFLDTGSMEFDEDMEQMQEGEFPDKGRFQLVYYERPDPTCECEAESAQQTECIYGWDMAPPVGKMVFTPAVEIPTLDLAEHSLTSCLGQEQVCALAEQALEQAGYDLSSCEDTDRFIADFGNWGFKLGGYPAIRQGDIRTKERFSDYTQLLFQYDMTRPPELEADTFVFFIRPEDLLHRRFDQVLLYWHNCY